MKYLAGIPVVIPRVTNALNAALPWTASSAARRPEKVLLTPEQAAYLKENPDARF